MSGVWWDLERLARIGKEGDSPDPDFLRSTARRAQQVLAVVDEFMFPASVVYTNGDEATVTLVYPVTNFFEFCARVAEALDRSEELDEPPQEAD